MKFYSLPFPYHTRTFEYFGSLMSKVVPVPGSLGLEALLVPPACGLSSPFPLEIRNVSWVNDQLFMNK